MARISAKIRKPRKRPEKGKFPLDTILEKRGRGRPARLRPSAIRGRGDNYRWILNQVWERLWPLLSKAQIEEDIIKAVQEGARPYAQEFVPGLSNLILTVLREPKFPQRRQARINFLADSLAGLGPDHSAQLPRCLRRRARESDGQLYVFDWESATSRRERAVVHARQQLGREAGQRAAAMVGRQAVRGA